MRPVLRLLPLSLCVALCLQARAEDNPPQNWRLCPIGDVVPPFADAMRTPEGLNIDPTGETPTDIEGDLLSGTDANPMFQGNVRGEYNCVSALAPTIGIWWLMDMRTLLSGWLPGPRPELISAVVVAR